MSDFKELVKNLYTSKNRELTEDKLKYIETTYGNGKEEDFVKNFYTTVGEDLPEEKFNYIKDTYLKKKEPAIGLGYEKLSEASRMGGLPKQEKPLVLKTAGTTTPSVSTKSALQGIKGTSTPPTGVTKIKEDVLPSDGMPPDIQKPQPRLSAEEQQTSELAATKGYVGQETEGTQLDIILANQKAQNIPLEQQMTSKEMTEQLDLLMPSTQGVEANQAFEAIFKKEGREVELDGVNETQFKKFLSATGIADKYNKARMEYDLSDKERYAVIQKFNQSIAGKSVQDLKIVKARLNLNPAYQEYQALKEQAQAVQEQWGSMGIDEVNIKFKSPEEIAQYNELLSQENALNEQADAIARESGITKDLQDFSTFNYQYNMSLLRSRLLIDNFPNILKEKQLQDKADAEYEDRRARFKKGDLSVLPTSAMYVGASAVNALNRNFYNSLASLIDNFGKLNDNTYSLGDWASKGLTELADNAIITPHKEFSKSGYNIDGYIVTKDKSGAISVFDKDFTPVQVDPNLAKKFNEEYDKKESTGAEKETMYDFFSLAPQLADQFVTMYSLVGGGRLAQVGLQSLTTKAISKNTGMTAASYLMTYEDYKKTGIENGLSDTDAHLFASISAMTTSLLEGISPNENIIPKSQVAKALEAFTASVGAPIKTRMKAVAKALVVEPTKEIVQEITQIGGDILTETGANAVLGKDVFDAATDMDEIRNTAVLTFGTTALAQLPTSGMFDTKNKKEWWQWASKDVDKLIAQVQEDVKNGLYTEEKAQIIVEKAKAWAATQGKIPDETEDVKRAQITPLLMEKVELLETSKGLDKVFQDKINKRIDAIDKEIVGIMNKPVSEFTTEVKETTTEETDGKGRTEEAISAGTDVLEEGVGMATEPGKEGVAGEDIQAEKVLEPAKPSENISTAADSKGVYIKDGEAGIIRVDGQLVVFETNDKIIELGNKDELAETPISEFGIEKEELFDVQVNEDNSVVVEGVRFVNNFSNPQAAINTDADGNIVSINLETEDGKKRTIRGQRAEEIAYQYKLKEFEQNATEESIARLEQEVTNLEGKAEKAKSKTKKRSTAKRKPKEVVSEKVTEVTAPAIEVTPTAEAKTTTKPVAERIADLRAAEKAEYDAMADPKDKAKRKEIYDKYDKLITPLIAEQKADIERTINNLPDNLLFITHITSEGNAINIYNNNLLMPAGVSSTTGIVSKEKLKQILFDLAEGKSPHRGYLDMFIGAIDRTVLENTPGKSLQTKLENYLDENFIEDVAKTQLPSSLNIGYFTNGVLNTKYDTGLTALKKPKSETKATEAATAEPVKEPAKPEAKKSKPEQIGEGLLDLLGLAPEGEESTGTEFQDGVKPQFKVDLNENLSEEQADEVKKIFDEVLDNPNASNSEVINIDDTIDPSIPTQQITISPTDKRPEAGLMSKLRVPLDFIFGKSVGLGMSDTLTTGERTVDVMNPKTGKIEQKTIREEGGIGYPFKSLMDLMNGKIPKGGKIFGWASVGEGAGTAMINAAKKANKITGLELKKQYFNNLNLTEEQKQRINDAIPDNKEYGLVSIYKMGNDGILSNEAHTREAFRQIETSLNESEKELFFKLAKERLTSIKWEGKEDYISLINSANNFVELENILHGKDSKLPLGAKASIVQNVFLSTEKTVSTETGNKLGELLKSKGISIESVSRAIEEPAMKGIDKGQPMLLLAIDPDSKVIEDVNRERHNNYPYGVEGFPIGVFNETTQMHRISPEMMDNFVKTATTTVDENAKKDGKNVRVSIYQAANGNFYAQEGKGVKKFSVKDKKGNNLFGTSKEELLNKLKKEGYKLSESTVKERYTQKINGTTFNNLLQKAKTGFISIFNNPKLSAQEKLVKYLQKAFPGISVEVNLNEYKKLEDDFRAQKLFNKDGKSYGFVKDGRVYLNPEYLNNNTPIHEFGHVWNSFAKNYKPEIYAKGVELVNNSKYQSFVLNDAQYQKLIKAEFGADAIIKDKVTGKFIVNENSKNAKEIKDAVADEALAKAIGDKGELFVNEAQKRSFANWLNKLFDAIKQIAGFETMTPEQFQNLSLNQFVDAAVKEILSGKKVSDITSKDLSAMTRTSAKFSLKSQNDKIKDFIAAKKKAGESDKDIKAGLELVADKLNLTPEDINNLMGVESDEAKPLKGFKQKEKPAKDTEGEKTGTRAFATKSVERAGVPIEDIPSSLKNYMPTTVEEQQKIAEDFIRKHGIDNTITQLRLKDSGIDPKNKPVLASVLLKELYAEQNNTKDIAEIEKIAKDVHNVLDTVLTAATEAAQFMAMMREFYNSNPYNYVAQVTRLIEKNINEPIKANVSTAVVDINKANKNAAGQAASNIVKEVVTSKVTSAKEKFERSKANLKALWKKSFNIGIASNQYEAAKNDVQFAKALTIMAKDFVVYQSVQFSEFLKEVAIELGLKESDIDQDHLRKIFEKAKSAKIQENIKVGLKELELKLKDLIESHYSASELEGKLIDKLKKEFGVNSEFGLNDAAIKELEEAIKREIKVLTAKEKIKALKALGIKEQKDVNEILSLSEEGLLNDNAILETLGDKLGIKKLTAEEAAKLADLAKDIKESKEDRIKARNIQKFEDYKFVLAKKYKIQDFLISNYLTNIFGSLTSNEKNIAGNVSETILLVGELMGNALASGNPKDIQRALKALVDGNIRGFDFTKEVLTTGVASYKEPGDIRARNMWELIMDRENDLTRIERNLQTLFRLPYLGPTLLAERRFWNRALLSMDSLSGTTNNELGSLLAATREADKQKLRGVKRTKFIEEQMANSAEAKEEARNYATSLGYKPGTGEFNRAVANYLVSKRPEAIKKAAAEYSARATLTQTPPPSTMTGAIANGLNDVISKNPNIKFFVPVVNTFANLIVKNIERSPFEFFSLAFDAGRAASGVESAKAGLTKAEVARRMKTAAVWTAISVLLFALAGGTDDDEEGFEVFGSGTGDPAVDNARRALGWKPNTVRFSKDGGYYNFEFLPFGFVLGMIGNMRDYFKYKNKPAFAIRQAQAKKIFGKNLDALDKNEREQLEAELAIPGKYNISAQEKKEFSNLLSELASTPVTYSFQLLKSLGELVNAVGEGAGAIKTALKSITNISRGLAAPRYLGEVRDIFDNKLYDTKEFRNVIGANVPFVKLGNVKLDAFGREIEKYKSESILSGIKYALTRGFYNPPTITPLDQFLWENGVGVSVPSNTPSMAYTEDVYREYIVTRGKILITNLTEALKNKEFEGLSPQEVLEVVNIYVTNVNAEARDITDEKLDKLK